MKRPVLYTLLITAGLVIWLLWPLASDSLDFEWDQARMTGKKNYLSQKVAPPAEPPNVLLIMVDDLSKADITTYEESGPVPTPNINRLAGQGALFDNAYVTHAVCSPSRAAVITGRYPQRFGFEHQMHDRYLKNRLEYLGFRYFVDSDPWVPQWQSAVPDEAAIEKQGLPPTEVTMAEIMRKYGFATGLVGKWHLGTAPFNEPCALGFDEFYGFNASHSLYAPEGTDGIIDQKIAEDWTDQYIWEGQRNGPHAITRDCNTIPENKYLTFRIADESVEFMRRHRNDPFFLWTSFNAPHTPLQAPVEYVEKFRDVNDPVKRVHYAMIAALDDAIGQMLDFMTSSGLDSNTLVFFISDNGGAEYNLTTNNGQYRGGKITDFEGGLKVPMAMAWRGKIEPGIKYSHPVISTDILATIAAACDLNLPSDRVYDGADLVEALKNNAPVHDYLHWRKGYNHSVRDSEWKLSWSEKTGRHRLFNLAMDPYETTDLYGENDVVTRLKRVHEEWDEQMAAQLWPALIDFYYEDNGERYWFDN